MKKSGHWRTLLGIITATAILSSGARAQTPEELTVPPLLNRLQTSLPLFQPEATAYMIWEAGDEAHQVWYRITGGSALFRQRLRMYQEAAPPRTPNTLPPANARIQELTSNEATRWYPLPIAQGLMTYYIDGDHIRSGSLWEDDRGVVVQKIRYSNGDLYRIGFEDRLTLDDYNDLLIEVAVVRE